MENAANLFMKLLITVVASTGLLMMIYAATFKGVKIEFAVMGGVVTLLTVIWGSLNTKKLDEQASIKAKEDIAVEKEIVKEAKGNESGTA